MAKTELAIGQVGSGAFPSYTGIDRLTVLETVQQRIIIVEPPGNFYYEDSNQYSVKVFERNGQRAVIANIYEGSTEIARSSIGLLFLENVINDPGYHGKKDIVKMLSFFDQIISPEGIVVFTDTFLRNYQRYIPLFDQIVSFCPVVDFKVIIDQLSSNKKGVRQDYSMEKKKEILLRLAEKLSILDPALVAGIEKGCAEEESRWLVLQKNATEIVASVS